MDDKNEKFTKSKSSKNIRNKSPNTPNNERYKVLYKKKEILDEKIEIKKAESQKEVYFYLKILFNLNFERN